MTFDPKFTVGDLYHSWPYASRYVRETYDPDLIEAQAVLMLSRALAIRRTVAFVGAGVSMSYGRISWQDLVRELTEKALHDANNWKDKPDFADIDRLIKTLES